MDKVNKVNKKTTCDSFVEFNKRRMRIWKIKSSERRERLLKELEEERSLFEYEGRVRYGFFEIKRRANKRHEEEIPKEERERLLYIKKNN